MSERENSKVTAELVRLLQFVLDKGDKPMWLSDGWREDAQAAIAAVNGSEGLGKTAGNEDHA